MTQALHNLASDDPTLTRELGEAVRGVGAAEGSVLLLDREGKTLRFALMPDGKDPDDMVRTGGASAMRLLLDKAEPLTEMIWRSETDGHTFDTPERRASSPGSPASRGHSRPRRRWG